MRVRWAGVADTSLEPIDRLRMVAGEVVRHADVEEHKRMTRPLGEVQLEKVPVARAFLALSLWGPVVSGVKNNGFQPGDFSVLPQRGENLLVNPAFKCHPSVVTEQLDMIDSRSGPGPGIDELNGNHEPGDRWGRLKRRLQDCLSGWEGEGVVSIQPKDPFSGCVLQ